MRLHTAADICLISTYFAHFVWVRARVIVIAIARWCVCCVGHIARFGVQRSLFIRCVMCVDVRCFVIQIVDAASTLLPMFCSRRSPSVSIICLLTMLLCANIVTSSKLNEWLLTAAWMVAALSSRRNVCSYDFQAYLRSFQCSVDDCYSPCHQFDTRNHTFVPILVFIFHSAEKWADAR